MLHGVRGGTTGSRQRVTVSRIGARGSFVVNLVEISARLSGRYHCGLDRSAWIWADAPD